MDPAGHAVPSAVGGAAERVEHPEASVLPFQRLQFVSISDLVLASVAVGIRLQARVSRLARGSAAHDHIFTTPAIGHTRPVWLSSGWEPLAGAQLRASVSQAVGAVAFSMI
jgi:hypothetical protein